MIPQEQLDNLKDHLVHAENPLFFFDDDVDGLCAFLLLQELNHNSHYMLLKGGPELTIEYLYKIKEISPDLVIILDKPQVSQEFLDNVHVPVFWLDHHPLIQRKGVHYLNPLLNDNHDNRPTTYWAAKITNKHNWIAVLGCISDWFLPEYIDEFIQKNPDLITTRDIEHILYESPLGAINRTCYFLLKGKTSDVKKRIHLLTSVAKAHKEFDTMLERAKKEIHDNDMFLIFIYESTKNSYTKEIANYFSYLYPEKFIIVGRTKQHSIRMSLRYRKEPIPHMLSEIFTHLQGYGGGHEHACGAHISEEDLPQFIEMMRNAVERNIQKNT